MVGQRRARRAGRKLLTGGLLGSVLASMLVFATTGIAGANSFTIQLNRVSDGVAPWEDWRAADNNTPTGDPLVTQAADDANGDGIDADPGDDVNAHDSYGANGVGIVRTLDKVRWRVAYALSKNIGDDNNALGVQIKVDVPKGFTVDIATLPPSGAASACPSGATTTAITAAMNPDPLMVGGTRINCLFPSPFDISSSVSRFFEFEATVLGSLPNGVTAAGANEYAPTIVMSDTEGTPTVTRTRADHPAEAVIVSAAPRYDLVKYATGNFAGNEMWSTVYAGGQLYFRMPWTFRLKAGDADKKGLSSLGTGLSIQDVYENLTGGMGALPYALATCTGGSAGFFNVVCTQPGGAGTPIQITFDFSINAWASYLASLGSVAPGDFLTINIDIPYSYVDTQNGNPTDGVGSVLIRNHISDGYTGTTAFDPNDVTGVSNYLAGEEPRPIVTTPAQVDGHQNTFDKTMTLAAAGVGGLGKMGQATGTPISGEPNILADLSLIDGQQFITALQVKINNNFAPAGTIVCDKWDNARTGIRGNSETQFIKRADPVTISGALPYVIEYGKSDTWGKGVADSGAPHAWWMQNNTTCGDTDPADLGGGTRWVTGAQVDWTNSGLGTINSDDLNMVRVRWIDVTIPGLNYNFWLFWQAKDIDSKLWHLNSSAGYSPLYATANKWIVPSGVGCNNPAQTCPDPPSNAPLNPDGYVNTGATGVTNAPWSIAAGLPAAYAWQHADPELQVDSCSFVGGANVCAATTAVNPDSVHTFRMRLSACIGSLQATVGEANIAPMTVSNHKGGSCNTRTGARYDLVMSPTLVDPYNAAIPGVELVDMVPPGFIPRSSSLPWKTVNGSSTWTAADGCPVAGCEVVWDVGTIPANGFSPTVDLNVYVPLSTPYATYPNRARGRYALFDQPGAWVPQNVQVSPSGSALINKSVTSGVVPEGTPATFNLSVRDDSANVWDTADAVDILPYNGDGRGTVLSGPLVLQGATATAALKTKMDLFVSGTAPATLDALDAPTGPPYAGVPPGVTYPAPIFSATDRLLDPRFNRTATALGGANWPCKVDWSSGTLALVAVAPAVSCPSLDAITAIRMVGYDAGKPIGAQNLPASDGNSATGFLASGEIATVTVDFGTQNLEPLDKMVNTVRGTFGNSYAGGTAESDSPPLPADFNAGATITMYDGVIGNVLFADLNANGMKDAGEPGIPNVTLELLDAAGLPAVDADGVPIPNVTTNGSGQYVFVGLMPGTYKVRVLAAELSAGGDLLGARISPIAGNPDDNRDEAVDQHLLTGFVTGPMTLSIGGEPTGEPDSSGLVPAGVRDVDTNLTMDLGVVPPAALTLTKSASPTKIHSGGSVNYTFVARSTGGALHNVSMTDSDLGCAPTLVSGDTNSNSILETSETWTYTCTLLNVTDALDGTSNTDHTNTANVTGLDVLNATVSNSASATVDIIASTIAVVKSASKSAIREGDTVTYTFDVTSTGDPLSNVTLSDSDAPCNTTLTGPTGDDNTNSKLDAGEIWHYTCSVVVTDALDGTTNTDHTNTVTVHGDDPLSLQMTNTATKTIDIVSSTIKVVKSASPNVIHEGDPVMYTFVVTSTGDPVDHVALSDTDAACNGSLSGPTGDTGTAGVLIPGETWTYTCTVASVTDALDGATGTTHTNTVTVNAEDPSGASISDDDTVTVDIVASTIAVTKVGNPKSIHEGDTVTYTFEVTGTGDPISSVTVVDTDAACNSSMSGPTGDNGDGIFQAGETWKYTCDVAVTDALDGTTNTDHTNTVTASGKDLAGTTISANASETVDIVASQIGVTKTANVDPIHEGDTVTYTFHVTNVGDPLSNVTLNDTDSACNTSLVGPTGGDGNAFLDDGEEWTYTCDVTVTDALDGTTNTDHTNTVTATGDDPAGVSSTADATETVDIVGSSLDISKTPSTLALHEGETVTYTFVVTGHGDPQHNVTVSDSDAACNTSLAGPTGGDGNAFLNDGEGWTYTCVVVVTDALDGTALTDHTNTVDARALDPLGNPATATAQATVDIVGATLNVVKSANPTRIHEGGTVTYSFDVTTALDPIWNVTLSDTDAPCNASMTAPTGDDGDSILQVGEIWHYTCTVIVTDALDGTTNTDHTNTATVNGEDSLGAPLTWTDGEIVDIIGSKVAITKTPSLPAIHTGESVTYTFVATLVGDPVTSPTINDSDTQCNASMSTPSGDTNNDGILQATEQWTYTCTLAVTDALDGSSNTDHTNTVQFSGIDPLLRTESASTTATVNIVGSDLSLKKTATPKAIMPGESVTYTFELTATGDPVSNPVVTDSQCTVSALTGDANGNGKVDQGETWTGTCTVANVTDATDGTANSMHTNTANANGTDPLGAPLVATANAEVRFLGSLGDYVWSDINHDGQQSTSEPAIGGVKVELYECADGNSATCTLLRTTTTDTSGRYLFDRLAAGHYQLKFIAPDGTIPTDMAMGGSTGSDSDIAGDGRTLVIDLKAGERNMTLDAGYTSAFNLLLDKSVQGGDAQTDLSPGDKVAFVIDVSNDGQGAVPAEVHMNDPLPAGMTYVSHTAPDGWTCSVTNNTLSCIKPNMLAGERSSFTITATLDATAAGGDLKNVANVTTIGVEGKTTDNQHTAEIVVKGTDSNAVPPAQPAPLTPNRVPPADTTRAALPYTGRDLWEEALVAFGLIALGGLASITSQRRRRKLRLPTDWAQAFRCPDCC